MKHNMRSPCHKGDEDAARERARRINGCVILSKGEYFSELSGGMVRVWEKVIVYQRPTDFHHRGPAFRVDPLVGGEWDKFFSQMSNDLVASMFENGLASDLVTSQLFASGRFSVSQINKITDALKGEERKDENNE